MAKVPNPSIRIHRAHESTVVHLRRLDFAEKFPSQLAAGLSPTYVYLQTAPPLSWSFFLKH